DLSSQGQLGRPEDCRSARQGLSWNTNSRVSINMHIAAIQMNSSAEPADNLARAQALLAQAAADGADIAVLPENFAVMNAGRKATLAAAEADGHGPIQDAIAHAAQQHGLWIVAGTLPLQSADGQRVRPASPVYDSNGARVACYNKIHLF